MPGNWAARINSEAFVWATHLGHACAWGLALTLAAWLLCRPRVGLPAATRGWLWWLVCLKMVFDLCGAAPLPLPILPAARAIPLTISAPFTAGVPGQKLSLPVVKPISAPTLDEGDAPRDQNIRMPLSLWTLLLAIWILGIIGGSLLVIRQAAQMRHIRAQSLPIEDTEILAEARRLALALGLTRVPCLYQSLQVAAPCVTGILSPTILLPVGVAETLSLEELRLALAHELAHLRRGDLLLAAMPTITRLALFFFPPAWLAISEWAGAREEACDALALGVTGASPARYGSLLLKVAVGTGKSGSVMSLSMASAYPALKRRLVSLKNAPRRMTRLTRCLPALALPLLVPWRLTTVSLPLTQAAETPALTHYSAIDLGTLGAAVAEAASLNSAGQVVGQTRQSPGSSSSHGFLWSKGREISLTRQWNSQASGINDSGQIILSAYTTPGHPRALVWDGARHRLGTLPGYPYTQARGINNSGQVVGCAEAGGHDQWRALIARAFLWSAGRMTDLGTLGGSYSCAYGVNSAGTVVGKADTETFGATHAFLWTDGSMQDLGTLGGVNSLAYHINDSNQVVGSAETSEGDTRHAFLWQDGQMRDLGTLPGTTRSAAYDVNAAGTIVGSCDTGDAGLIKHAFLWQNGHMTDLNTLLPARPGWILAEARAINDSGQIVANGTLNGQPHAFLLTPK